MSKLSIIHTPIDHITFRTPRPCYRHPTVSVRTTAIMTPKDATARKAELDGIAKRLAAKFPGVPNISPSAVSDLQCSGQPVIFIDVRTPDEYQVSQIPGSLAIGAYNMLKSCENGVMKLLILKAAFSRG